MYANLTLISVTSIQMDYAPPPGSTEKWLNLRAIDQRGNEVLLSLQLSPGCEFSTLPLSLEHQFGGHFKPQTVQADA